MSSGINPLKQETVNQLKVRVYENRDAMGKDAAYDVVEKLKLLLKKKENVRMIFAAAPSQSEFLKELSKADGIDWSRVTAFHMDEYIGLPDDAPQKFSQFLKENIFDIVNPATIHLINSSNTIEEECKRYGDLIREAPIDLISLGIGENGHIAFNDPPVADFNDHEVIKPVELDHACRQQQVNDGCFPTLNDVPTHALTLTIPTMMSADVLYCIVPNKNKHEAVKNTLNGPIDTSCPASILRRHPNCTLYCDTDAYGL
jgi:glucosamine-6-phosphate deaminase